MDQFLGVLDEVDQKLILSELHFLREGSLNWFRSFELAKVLNSLKGRLRGDRDVFVKSRRYLNRVSLNRVLTVRAVQKKGFLTTRLTILLHSHS